MTSTSRQSLATLATDLQEVLAWGGAAEASNAAIVAERDAAIARVSALEAHVEEMADDYDEMLDARDATIAAKDAEIVEHVSTIFEMSAEIARLTALLNPKPAFTLYNEMKSVPSLPLPDILVIYEGQLHASGVSGEAAPDPAFLRQSFAAIKAANPGVTMVVLDQESWWTNGRVEPAQVPWYVTLVNVAKEFWSDVGLYGFPERYTGFLTGSAADNPLRLDSWKNRQAPEIAAAVTFFCPSFYFINPVHNNETKRNLWIDTYVDWCNPAGVPSQRIVPFLWPRIHGSVDPTTPWVDGPTWRSTLNKVRERCQGAVIFGRSGNDDPDPRPSTPWWLETEAFLAAL
jgi:hypothetical protein